MYIERSLRIKKLIDKKSHFLFGPRATGKSSLIKHELGEQALFIDLLHSETYLRLLDNPSQLELMIALTEKPYVVIDEIQRVPELLNEVHRLIENKQVRFLLTGSSARKLKRQGVNLLAGRARQAEPYPSSMKMSEEKLINFSSGKARGGGVVGPTQRRPTQPGGKLIDLYPISSLTMGIYPLTYHELLQFNLQKYLQYGGLPMVALSDEPEEDLAAYVHTYLEEEIKAESIVQKLPAFSRFLQLSALTSGTTLNYTSIASDAGVSNVTLREYYQILEDTFLGFTVLPWRHSVKRKAVATARFYYFDIGVKNRLARIHTIPEQSDLYGQAFEHFIAMELRAYNSYSRKNFPLCFWRTAEGIEVDFVIDDKVAIEVKSANRISAKHLKGLKYLMEENKIEKYYLISQDPIGLKQDGIFVLPWEHFLKKLWDGEIF